VRETLFAAQHRDLGFGLALPADATSRLLLFAKHDLYRKAGAAFADHAQDAR